MFQKRWRMFMKSATFPPERQYVTAPGSSMNLTMESPRISSSAVSVLSALLYLESLGGSWRFTWLGELAALADKVATLSASCVDEEAVTETVGLGGGWRFTWLGELAALALADKVDILSASCVDEEAVTVGLGG